MRDGYPEASELKAIRTWHYKDVFTLVEYMRERWHFGDWGWKEIWKGNTLVLEISTGGWSGNEDMIDALLENKTICALHYEQWRRGGHYTFKIKAAQVGFYTALKTAQMAGCSRQNVQYQSAVFERIRKGKRNFLYRQIKQLKRGKKHDTNQRGLLAPDNSIHSAATDGRD